MTESPYSHGGEKSFKASKCCQVNTNTAVNVLEWSGSLQEWLLVWSHIHNIWILNLFFVHICSLCTFKLVRCWCHRACKCLCSRIGVQGGADGLGQLSQSLLEVFIGPQVSAGAPPPPSPFSSSFVLPLWIFCSASKPMRSGMCWQPVTKVPPALQLTIHAKNCWFCH